MIFSDKFVDLIKRTIFFSVIWVISSFIIGIASLIVFLPFIIFKDRNYFSSCVALYLVLQVFFTSAYIYAIIDSVSSKGGKQ